MVDTPLCALIRKYITILLVFLFPFHVFAQSFPQPTVQTPEVSAFAKYGEIPVTLFNGLANISIPLTEIRNGDIVVPLSVNYYASGNKTDARPGWVGLGWSFIGGGVITRHKNGFPDEGWFTNRSAVWDTDGTPYYFHQNIEGYMDFYSILANTDWYDLTKYKQLRDYKIIEPDEFSFIFPGLSGSFFMNHEGKWIVKCQEDPNLKISHELAYNFPLPYPQQHTLTLPKIMYKFTITTSSGFKYSFGGSYETVDFTHTPSNFWKEFYNGGIAGPNRAINYPSPDDPTETSAWHLTEILSPTGRRVNYYYDKESILQQSTYSEQSESYYAPEYLTRDINQTAKTLTRSCILNRIESSNSFKYTFEKSRANDLKQIYHTKPQSNDGFFCPIGGPNGVGDDYKLDRIEVKYKDAVTKYMKLEYIERPTERLKLEKVTFLDALQQAHNRYVIEYNTKRLPAYNSAMEDHWGFYNGRDYYLGASGQDIQPKVIPNMTFYESRNPDPTYMDAEMIKKIRYTNGGYTEFFFEPHDYSKVVVQTPKMGLEILTKNEIAGGVRIRKIISSAGGNSIPVSKEYFYVQDYKNKIMQSSGVLAGRPVYDIIVKDERGYYQKKGSLPVNFTNTTNGNHITYTKVVERTANGGGFTEFEFTNQDNGYLDTDPIAWSTIGGYTTSAEVKLFGKLDHERGELVYEKKYNEQNQLVSEIVNEYDDPIKRRASFGRSINYLNLSTSFVSPVIALPIFYKCLWKTRETNKQYLNGILQTSSVKNFIPDTFGQLGEVNFIDGKDKLVAIQYRYPYNSYDIDINNVYPNMVTNNNIRAITEASTKVNGMQTYLVRNNYYAPSTDRFAIASVLSQRSANDSFVTTNYNSHDANGNLLSTSVPYGKSIGYVWSYKGEYLAAKVENASLLDIAYSSFEDEDLGGFTVSQGNPVISAQSSRSGKACLSLNNTYSIDKYNLNLGKKYIISYWTKNSIPFLINGSSANATRGETIGDWTLFTHRITNSSSISLSGSGMIDDVRLYPSGASMVTYTYDPPNGLASQADENNFYTNYTYDSFGRLSHIRDNNGNIQKMYSYHSNLPFVTYGNFERSIDFYRQGCAPNGIGSKVIYVVPANKFSSTVSQADADAQAQQDVDRNGQNYANNVGTCKQKATVTVSYVPGPEYQWIYYTVTKSFDDGLATDCVVGLRTDASGIPALPPVHLEKGETEKVLRLDLVYATYVDLFIVSSTSYDK